MLKLKMIAKVIAYTRVHAILSYICWRSYHKFLVCSIIFSQNINFDQVEGSSENNLMKW